MFNLPSRMVKLPLFVFLGFLAMGLSYSATRPSVYQANARIWVQSKRTPEVMGGQAAQSVYTPLTEYYNSPIVTASEVLRSKLVITQAFEKLKAANLRHLPSPGELRDGLSVLPSKDSDVMVIQYRSADQNSVAPVLQALLEGFIKVNNTQSAGTATQSRLSLERQLETLKKNYQVARERLLAYQDSNNVVDVQSEISSVMQRITDLKNEAAKSKREASAAASKVEYLKRQLGLDPQEALAVERIAKDEILKGLKEKLAEDQVALIDARTTYREAHPRVQQLEKSIDKINQAVKDRLATLLGSGMNAGMSSRITADADSATHDPMREQLLSELVRAQSEQLAAESGLASLESLADAQQAELKSIPQHQDKVARLVRAEQVAGDSLSEVEKKLQDIKVVEAVAYNSSNVQIIDMPEKPSAPISPNRGSDMLMSVLFGLAGAAATFLALWLRDPILRRTEDAFSALAFPVIGWVPDLAASAQDVPGIETMARTQVNLAGLLKPEQKHLIVTSPDAGDGKSTVAAGLALAFAAAGKKVLLIDANFVSPKLDKLFGVSQSPGLRDYMESGEQSVALSVVRNVGKGLQFVPAGTGIADPKLLTTPTLLEKLLVQIRSDAQIVIIDTASVSQSAAGVAMLDSTSHLLVVVRLGHSLKNSIHQLAGQLQLRHFNQGSCIITDATEEDLPAQSEFEVRGSAEPQHSLW